MTLVVLLARYLVEVPKFHNFVTPRKACLVFEGQVIGKISFHIAYAFETYSTDFLSLSCAMADSDKL
jgi:hypothetical protein